MASKVVIFIQSNPQESHRPCEGIRIALGLAASHHAVDLILAKKAPLLLTDDLTECVDEESTKQYLLTLKAFIPTFYLEKESTRDITISEDEYRTTPLSRNDIAQKISASESFLLF